MKNSVGEDPDTTTPGISGRKLTAAVLIMLLLICATLAYLLLMYDRLDKIRNQSNARWREVANLLDQDYLACSQKLMAVTQSAKSNATTISKFQEVTDRFRTTAEVRQQREQAEEVEQLCAAADDALLELPAATLALQQKVQSYNELLQQERQLLESFGGQMLRVFVALPIRQDFLLAR
ncbi:MAG: hypothetical protein KF752_14045 [Pirellulaceae bacterium]|nr:hypothetical protein [Pirellulaceae bacterium]